LPGGRWVSSASEHRRRAGLGTSKSLSAREIDLVVDLREGQPKIEGLQGGLGVEPDRRVEEPLLLAVAPEEVDPGLVLGDQQIGVERRDALIVLELLASIVGFGPRGEDLDQDQRVEKGVELAVEEARLTADHDDVRV